MAKRALLATTAANLGTIAVFREAAGFVVPPLGLIGPQAIREAFDGDLNQLRDLLQSAVRATLELEGEEDWWPYMHAVFSDYIVAEHKDGRLMRYGYTVDGTEVTLTSPVEVQKTFVPVASGDPETVREAANSGVFRIRVIRAGLSANNALYPEDVLREAVPLFEGVRVFVKSDAEHLAGAGKDVRNIIGALKNVEFVEGTGGAAGSIEADLVLIEPEGAIGVKLREAWSRGLAGLFGFSIDAAARALVRKERGVQVREAREFVSVKSVDLIVEPGAGGEIVSFTEAKSEVVMTRTQIIALLEAKGLLKGKDVESLTDDELATMLREALPDPAPPADPVNPDRAVTASDLRLVEARIEARNRVSASTLPEAARPRVLAALETEGTFTEAAVTQAIQNEADYLASFTESGRVTGLGSVRVQSGETQFEKTEDMLDAFFDPTHRDHRHARSFKECYVQVTGDALVTGRLGNVDQVRFREALESGSWPEVLGDSIRRRMVGEYNNQTNYDVWRQMTGSPVPIADFRTNERTRYGGYGDLPAVAESGNYAALTSPTDEKASYAVSKRGGTEKITLEMIKNDDVGAIRRVPIALARSAKRTLSRFVLNIPATNAAIYDGVALFHASHSNLGATALGSASIAAGRLALKNQTEKDSDEKLSLPAKSLWVPDALEEAAVDIFRRNTEQDKTFVQSLSLDVIPVWCWDDANDWMMTVDPMDAPFIEIGFLDGQEEPEIFVQDNPTVGSLFTNDQTTYKIRHIYGATVVDYRPAFKSVVA